MFHTILFIIYYLYFNDSDCDFYRTEKPYRSASMGVYNDLPSVCRNDSLSCFWKCSGSGGREKFVKQYREIFEKDILHCNPYTLEMFQGRTQKEKFMASIFLLFAPLM